MELEALLGMLMPMGYMIGNGYVNPVGDTEDINSLRDTIAHFDGSTFWIFGRT